MAGEGPPVLSDAHVLTADAPLLQFLDETRLGRDRLAEHDTRFLVVRRAWRNTSRLRFVLCLQKTQARSRELGSRPQWELDPAPALRARAHWPIVIPGAEQGHFLLPIRSCSQLPSPLATCVQPQKGLRLPTCLQAISHHEDSSGRGDTGPAKLTRAELGATVSWLLTSDPAQAVPSGSRATCPTSCPFLPGGSPSPSATHGPALQPSCVWLIIQVLGSQARGSGGHPGVRVSTHLLIPGGQMRLLKQGGPCRSPDPNTSLRTVPSLAPVRSLPSGEGLNGGPRKIRPHPHPQNLRLWPHLETADVIQALETRPSWI